MQDTRESNMVYAVIGPFSSYRTGAQTLETLNLDKDRVEYAQINYKTTQNTMPVSSVEESMDEGV